MKLSDFLCSVVVLVLLTLIVKPGIAQDLTKATPWENDNESKSRFRINGEIELGAGANWNFDLDDEDKEGVLTVEPTVELGFTYAMSKNIFGYINFQYGREFEIEEEDSATYTPTLEVDEGFVQFDDLFEIDNVIKKTALTVGRFSFSDNREWYYDKSLDGVLLTFEFEPIDTAFSLSVNREELFGSDLLRHNDFDPVNNFIAVAEHEPFNDIDLNFAAYTIVRDDRSADNESPVFYGLGAYGELADERFSFWTDIAWARGEDDDEKISGYGLDIGGTLYFEADIRPYVTLGYALGSGDGDTDTDFRQTDMQGNSGKFGGVATIKYYGELLDPELSNLHIFTAGIGFRFGPTASVDFLLHYYRQDKALDELRSSDLDADPDGFNKEIGTELDIALGFGLSEDVETEFVLGYFRPGSAFERDDDDAFLVETKLSYSF